MAHLVNWRYNQQQRCFILKKTDGFKLFISKVRRVMGLDDLILRECHMHGVLVNNLCDESELFMRYLRRRFEPVEDDEEELPIVWWTFLESGHIKILWEEGTWRWFPAKVVLSTGSLYLLRQLDALTPNSVRRSSFLSQFRMDVGLRIQELMAQFEDDEDLAELGGPDFMVEEEMTPEEWLG